MVDAPKIYVRSQCLTKKWSCEYIVMNEHAGVSIHRSAHHALNSAGTGCEILLSVRIIRHRVWRIAENTECVC
jgi:hypothetical protein